MDILPLDGGVFPPEVMIIILLMLPVKTLFRFKLVAKSWYAFISSDYFAQNHLRYPNRTERLLTVFFNPRNRKPKINVLKLFKDRVGTADKQIYMPFSFNPHEELRLEDSCNGLVCLKANSVPNNIILWNPATRKFRCLRLPYIATYVYVGMCYIQETNDYKIVRIPNLIQGSVGNVWVYSLNSDSWEKLDVPFEHVALESGRPTVVNECIHWITNEGKGTKIAVWDAKDKVLRYMRLPVIERMSLLFGRHLAIIEGSLSIVVAFFLDSDNSELAYEVWKMDQYGDDSSWSPIFSISLPEIALPMGSWQDGKLLFSYHKRNNLRLLSYDPSTSKVQRFHYYTDFCLRFVNYVESLESVEGEMRRNSLRRVMVQPIGVSPTLYGTAYGGNSGNSSSGMVVSDGQTNNNEDDDIKGKRAEKLKRELKRLETSSGFVAERSRKG